MFGPTHWRIYSDCLWAAAGASSSHPDLSVPDHPEIFVVGDMGEVASDGEVLPQLGSVAMQSGEHVGRQIARRVTGEPGQLFKYWDKGCMATIGRGAGGRVAKQADSAGSIGLLRLVGCSPGPTEWNPEQDRNAVELGLVRLNARPSRRIIIESKDDEVKNP